MASNQEHPLLTTDPQEVYIAMNPKLVFTLWSFKELKYVLLAFLLSLFLSLRSSSDSGGINVISDKLVDQNATTQAIQIKDNNWRGSIGINPPLCGQPKT
ncbi:MAG: hypothetical protein LC127_15070 [Chitinophagales bacterium]|nr:hypothetical protein [Chitinophagales bacterium]